MPKTTKTKENIMGEIALFRSEIAKNRAQIAHKSRINRAQIAMKSRINRA